ncbi:MAG: hypothetical protein Q4E60_10575, partial [Bacteroidales bacterium]|nr:hypothetical protein [Bacteroidales bacterium]
YYKILGMKSKIIIRFLECRLIYATSLGESCYYARKQDIPSIVKFHVYGGFTIREKTDHPSVLAEG